MQRLSTWGTCYIRSGGSFTSLAKWATQATWPPSQFLRQSTESWRLLRILEVKETNVIGSRSLGRALAASVVMILTLSSCSAGDGSTEGQGVGGEELTILQPFETDQFDPTLNVAGAETLYFQLYDPLVFMSEDLEPQPALVESWEASEDGKQVTLQIRENVKFHDGTPLTAEDVAFNIERYRAEETGANIQSLLSVITSVQVSDELTVVVQLSNTSSSLFQAFSLLYVTKADSVSEIKTSGIGTGPFTLEEYIPGQEIRLSRNDEYWQPGLPRLGQISIKTVPQIESALLQFESGQGDLLVFPPFGDIERLREKGLTVETVGAGAEIHLMVPNQEVAPLNDARVRRAMHLAVDRERIVEAAFAGLGEPWCLPWPETSPAFDSRTARSCPQDLEQARKLLAEAGYADGFDITLFQNTEVPGSSESIQIIQANLAEIGIRADIEVVEGAQVPQRKVASDFDVYVGSSARGSRDPATLLGSTVVFAPERTISNFASEEYSRIVQAIQTTIDREAAEDLYAQLNTLMLEQMFVITLTPVPQVYAWRESVSGVDANPDGRLKLAETTNEE